MYVLIDIEQLAEKSRKEEFFEKMPDGRAILPISELKTMGSVTNVDVITTARELKELIRQQNEAGIGQEQENPEENVDDSFTNHPGLDEGEQPVPDTEQPESGQTETSDTETTVTTETTDQEGGEL